MQYDYSEKAFVDCSQVKELANSIIDESPAQEALRAENKRRKAVQQRLASDQPVRRSSRAGVATTTARLLKVWKEVAA